MTIAVVIAIRLRVLHADRAALRFVTTAPAAFYVFYMCANLIGCVPGHLKCCEADGPMNSSTIPLGYVIRTLAATAFHNRAFFHWRLQDFVACFSELLYVLLTTHCEHLMVLVTMISLPLSPKSAFLLQGLATAADHSRVFFLHCSLYCSFNLTTLAMSSLSTSSSSRIDLFVLCSRRETPSILYHIIYK